MLLIKLWDAINYQMHPNFIDIETCTLEPVKYMFISTLRMFLQIKDLLIKQYSQISMVYQQYFYSELASLSLRIFFTFSWG